MSDDPLRKDTHELIGDDPYAATRRAIVRAAAEVGKGIGQKSVSALPDDNYEKNQAEAFYSAPFGKAVK
jgi:hypothetical protein